MEKQVFHGTLEEYVKAHPMKDYISELRLALEKAEAALALERAALALLIQQAELVQEMRMHPSLLKGAIVQAQAALAPTGPEQGEGGAG